MGVGPGVADVGSAKGPMALSGTIGWIWTVFGPFLGLILITGLFAYLTRDSGSFVSAYNWRTIAVQTVIVGTAALGMTVIMIAGGIDLSVGSAVALVTVGMALTVRDLGCPMPVAMIGGVVLGGLCGLFNGGLITGLGVVPVHHHARESEDFPGAGQEARDERGDLRPGRVEGLVVRAHPRDRTRAALAGGRARGLGTARGEPPAGAGPTV